jgi:hypothetical protein
MIEGDGMQGEEREVRQEVVVEQEERHEVIEGREGEEAVEGRENQIEGEGEVKGEVQDEVNEGGAQNVQVE